MKNLIPYLMFNGNAENALNHYKSVLGGEIVELHRFSDAPPEGDIVLTEEQKKLIMNGVYVINESTTLMVSDAHPTSGNIPFGENISLAINADSKEDADAIFKGLSEGGKASMPMQETFWGAYFGMCTDKFGICWMINYDL